VREVTSTETRIGLSDYVRLNGRNLYSELSGRYYIVNGSWRRAKREKKIEERIVARIGAKIVKRIGASTRAKRVTKI
jgi:hypothetical protein